MNTKDFNFQLPTEQVNWIASAVDVFATEKPVNISVRHQNGELLAYAPLIKRKVNGVKYLISPGVEETYEPTGAYCKDPSSAQDLTKALLAKDTPLWLARVPDDELFAKALGQLPRTEALVLKSSAPGTPFIALEASWETPENKLNKGRQSDFRRSQRHAETLGTVTFDAVTPTKSNLEQFLETAFQIETKGWKGQAGTALAKDPKRSQFFRLYCNKACEEGILRICFLRINGEPIAMQIAVIQFGSYWIFKIGHDSAFNKCSPGLLLLQQTIKYAQQQGLRSFEFLGVDAPWIQAWTQTTRKTSSYRVFPISPQGLWAFSIHMAKWAYGKVFAQKNIFKKMAGKALSILGKLAGRSYVAGENLADALRVVKDLESKNISATLGFFDSAKIDTIETIVAAYTNSVNALAQSPHYLSIKYPALEFNIDLLQNLVTKARSADIRIHLDAMKPDSVEMTKQAVEKILTSDSNCDLGFTLPGRWARSLSDAKWAKDLGLKIRVVKGQWEDPTEPQKDASTGFLEIIKALAGHKNLVAIATHDSKLIEESVQILRTANTPCELELLFGLPTKDAITIAKELNLPVRIYVPFGFGYLPYAIEKAIRNPKMLLWILKDALKLKH